MQSKTEKQPTRAETEILRVLWSRGPSTVREIHDTINRTRELGYTTVLKYLQIMTAKGFVRRKPGTGRGHVYQVRESEHKTKKKLATDLVTRVFEGSAAQLMMHVLEGKRASKKELAELRRLIRKHEKERES